MYVNSVEARSAGTECKILDNGMVLIVLPRCYYMVINNDVANLHVLFGGDGSFPTCCRHGNRDVVRSYLRQVQWTKHIVSTACLEVQQVRSAQTTAAGRCFVSMSSALPYTLHMFPVT